jgi:hypothetical protein
MEEKEYFMPGDVVTIKQPLPNKPTMVVYKKKTLAIKDDSYQNKSEFFQGIICR